MDILAEETNVEFSINYNEQSEKFSFNFPSSVSNGLVSTKFTADTELCQRLGFGFINQITATNTSEPVKIGVDATSSKAITLVFDTGHVVVTCYNTSSNLASIGNNQFMASLFPDQAGAMIFNASLGHTPPTVLPPTFEGGQTDSVPLLCQLRKFNDAGDLVYLNWKAGAFLSGVLCGKV